MNLQLPPVTSLEQAPAVLQQIDAALASAGGSAEAGGLQIDASALTEFDTSAIALLLHAQRAAKASGTLVQVLGAPPKLRELAQLYGVEELLPLVAASAATVGPTAT